MVAPIKLRAILLCCALSACASLGAQTTARPAVNDGYPEQAYLSPSRYTNQYFGFSFELPPDAQLHTVAEQATRNGSVPLLDLAGPPPADAQIIITAFPTAGGKTDDSKLLLRQLLDQELARGVEELRGLSKASFSGRQFYLFETRRGIEHHMILATTAGDYVLRIVLAAHDEPTVKRLEAAFAHVVFFAPGNLPYHLDADAKPYDGPSISSHRLTLLESDPPAKHIDPGKVNGDFYENAGLGFSYRIPQGWTIHPEGTVQPAVERYRAKQDFGFPRMGRVERALVDSCSRTLFSAWTKACRPRRPHLLRRLRRGDHFRPGGFVLPQNEVSARPERSRGLQEFRCRICTHSPYRRRHEGSEGLHRGWDDIPLR